MPGICRDASVSPGSCVPGWNCRRRERPDPQAARAAEHVRQQIQQCYEISHEINISFSGPGAGNYNVAEATSRAPVRRGNRQRAKLPGVTKISWSKRWEPAMAVLQDGYRDGFLALACRSSGY